MDREEFLKSICPVPNSQSGQINEKELKDIRKHLQYHSNDTYFDTLRYGPSSQPWSPESNPVVPIVDLFKITWQVYHWRSRHLEFKVAINQNDEWVSGPVY